MIDHKLVRSESNPGALVNSDRASLEAYKKRKQLAQMQNERINTLEAKLSNIESLLMQILEKK